MTRTQALDASRALDEIEGFEMFMDRMEQVFREAVDWCEMKEFRSMMTEKMREELTRREKYLESL